MLRSWATDRPTLNKLTLLAILVMATTALTAPPLARAADPVVAAAGNIACDPASPYFAGGAGRRPTATRARPPGCSRQACPPCSRSATPSTAAGRWPRTRPRTTRPGER